MKLSLERGAVPGKRTPNPKSAPDSINPIARSGARAEEVGDGRDR
jgi:hypothetical protein